jgi:hypothetical protein
MKLPQVWGVGEGPTTPHGKKIKMSQDVIQSPELQQNLRNDLGNEKWA